MSDACHTTGRAAGFAAVLRGREFRLLWLADAQSLLGDQLARVALSVLVYDRTRSGLLTAAVYALTFLPALFGSVLLGPLADRLPRRALLVGGDVLHAVLLAVKALPPLPVAVLAGLLVLVVLVGTPCKAAATALVVDLLATQDYPVGLGLRAATVQAAQLAGFAVGGVAVATIGAHGALGLNAATFLISAVLIRFGLRVRPPAAAPARSECCWPLAPQGCRVLDGAEDLLRRLGEAGVMLGVISGAMEGAARTKMAPGKLNRYFVFGSYGSDSPDRTEVTRLAIAKAGRLHGQDLAPEEVYVVGDTPLDITSAHAASATAIGLASGHYDAEQLQNEHPEHVLGSLTNPFPGLPTAT